MNELKPMVGLLPLYLAFYDEVAPECRDGFTGYLADIVAELEAQGLGVRRVPICCVADEIAGAVQQFEACGIDCIVTLHLAYSPSMEAINALCGTPLPVVMLDTTMDAAYGIDVSPDRLMFNHGIHGVMDLACMLRRRGKDYEVVAGHYRDPAVMARVVAAVRRVSRSAPVHAGTTDETRPAKPGHDIQGTAPLLKSRLLRVGDAFAGMGDFVVEPAVLRDRFGIVIEQVGLEVLDQAVEAVSEAEVVAECAADCRRFDCELEEAVHRRATRVGLGLRRLLADGGYQGFSVNFQVINGKNRPASMMPFLEISKAMGRGLGYAGEGDMLTAALVGALAREFEAVTFTEIFCPDWSGSALFLSHMGEINPLVAGDRPRVFEKPLPFINGYAPAMLTCSVRPGPAVFVNLAPGPNDRFTLIVAPVDVLPEDASMDPAMRDNVRAWMRPRCRVSNFLESYSRAGGTHHSALVLGDHVDEIVAFGEICGMEVVQISAALFGGRGGSCQRDPPARRAE